MDLQLSSELPKTAKSAVVQHYMHPSYNTDAPHWPITARHEAGHAVAAIVKFREAGWHWGPFDRVLIRPGATKPYIDDRGRFIDCLGLVEGPSHWNPGLWPADYLRNADPSSKAQWHALMSIEVVSRLGGPVAQARAHGYNSKTSARWNAIFTGGCGDDYTRAEAIIHDMRAMTRCGSLKKFEGETYDLVKRYWPAIDALGEELLRRHVMKYDDAFAVVEPFVN